MANLNGKYLSDFEKIKKRIEKLSAKSPEREEALESLLTIYLEAQENKTEIQEIHEGTAEDYAREIAESLPKKKRPDFLKIAGICAVFAVFIGASILLLLNMSDSYLLKKRGFNHVLKSENEYSILVELQEHGVHSYIDEKYELHHEPAWKTEIFVTEKGALAKGFAPKNGIFADEITVDEAEGTVFVKMHCERITDEFGSDQIVSPAVPMHKNNEKFLEYGTMTHFGRSTVEIRIGEAIFQGVIGDIYVAKNGEIHFTAKTEFVQGELSGAEEIAESGKPVELYFGSICTIAWERRGDKPEISLSNLSVPEDYYPEYRSAILLKEKDGISVAIKVYIDRNEKIAAKGNSVTSRYDDEVIKNFDSGYMNDAVIYDGGEKIGLLVEYELVSGEKITEEWFFTPEDETNGITG
ncbi:MAG: hypothetical protein IKL18_07440 [Oscillospiraceae bacterium]|nr:hypothetical protein [Oscillospiraceae bacterium]MBR6657984.1 hypothetical protein [Oscillospiraceae bacterium]